MASRKHEYCCCAIPILNVGIYLTIIEQFSIGLLAGILAVATPQLVGAATPSFAPWLFAVGCFIVCAIQVLGFIGVFKEKAALFRTFVLLNSIAVSLVFGLGAAWIGLSASRHGTAQANCINNFFSSDNSTTTASTATSQAASAATSGEGTSVCNIFVWADIGVMGALWLIMLIFQGYLMLICRWYGSSQQADHSKYYSIYSVNAPEGIALGERQGGQDAWDPRPSTDSWSGGAARGIAASPDSPRPSDATERGYGVSAEGYPGKEPQYGYRSEPVQPEYSYSNEGPQASAQYGSPERSRSVQTYGRGAQPQSPPPGAGYPDHEEYQQSEGQQYVQHPARNYAQSTAPSYHAEHYQQQPYYAQR